MAGCFLDADSTDMGAAAALLTTWRNAFHHANAENETQLTSFAHSIAIFSSASRRRAAFMTAIAWRLIREGGTVRSWGPAIRRCLWHYEREKPNPIASTSPPLWAGCWSTFSETPVRLSSGIISLYPRFVAPCDTDHPRLAPTMVRNNYSPCRQCTVLLNIVLRDSSLPPPRLPPSTGYISALVFPFQWNTLISRRGKMYCPVRCSF